MSHLYYVGPVQNAKFKDFELKTEVNTRPKGNSGFIFHTEFQDKGFPNKGFEFQINNTGSDKAFRTGSISVPCVSPKDSERAAPVGWQSGTFSRRFG